METLWVVEACLSVGVAGRYVLIDDTMVAKAGVIRSGQVRSG
jgi:hypothetical protein